MSRGIYIADGGTPHHPLVEWRSYEGLTDLQAMVEGYIEAVGLDDGSTIWINEEGLYQFPDRVNWRASDLAGCMGRSDLCIAPLRGPAVLVGPYGPDDESLPPTKVAIRHLASVLRQNGELIQGEANA